MTPRSAGAALKSNLPLIALAVSCLTALGFLTNPVSELRTELTALERKVAAQDATIEQVHRYAKAAAIDLCLTRPDSTLARMQLDCRSLLNR
jgi:uncharacterized coiled-coil protein SlyX